MLFHKRLAFYYSNGVCVCMCVCVWVYRWIGIHRMDVGMMLYYRYIMPNMMNVFFKITLKEFGKTKLRVHKEGEWFAESIGGVTKAPGMTPELELDFWGSRQGTLHYLQLGTQEGWISLHWFSSQWFLRHSKWELCNRYGRVDLLQMNQGKCENWPQISSKDFLQRIRSLKYCDANPLSSPLFNHESRNICITKIGCWYKCNIVYKSLQKHSIQSLSLTEYTKALQKPDWS